MHEKSRTRPPSAVESPAEEWPPPRTASSVPVSRAYSRGSGIAGDLNNVSYVTLALIGEGGASPHDLVDMYRRGGQIYYAVAASRLYAEPKRLEQLDYVSSEKRPGKTRERTFYTLTDKGREALHHWILEPPALPRIQNEAVPKLMAGDILGDDQKLLDALLTLRDEIEAQQARLVEGRERVEMLPHRRSYLLLVLELGDRLLQAQREWLDDVERELRQPKEQARGESNRRLRLRQGSDPEPDYPALRGSGLSAGELGVKVDAEPRTVRRAAATHPRARSRSRHATCVARDKSQTPVAAASRA